MIGQDLVGLRGGNGFFRGYNPFDLYGAAERERCKPLPPHAVFAELDKDEPDDACAFLNAYGPLSGTNSFLLRSALKLDLWKSLTATSPEPQEYFRAKLGTPPLLPDPPAPEDEFYSYPLAEFWRVQRGFELTLRLHTALEASANQAQKVQQVLANMKIKWSVQGPDKERQYIDRARTQVITTMNAHLLTLQPRVAGVPPASATAVTGVWGCYTLLEAMYLMLFFDIAGWRGRITQCEKCRSLFYTTLERGKYCTPVCENRARALRAYHNKKGGS